MRNSASVSSQELQKQIQQNCSSQSNSQNRIGTSSSLDDERLWFCGAAAAAGAMLQQKQQCESTRRGLAAVSAQRQSNGEGSLVRHWIRSCYETQEQKNTSVFELFFIKQAGNAYKECVETTPKPS